MHSIIPALPLCCLLLAGGCSHGKSAAAAPAPTTSEHFRHFFSADVQTQVDPPPGWLPDPLKSSSSHKHVVWLSPSRRTAYGVIYFSLPLPVGHEVALWGFLQEMRRTEGQATLVEKRWDDRLPGIRFVARGGQHVVRVNLVVRGFHGWACYAGTLRGDEIVPDELELAEDAREQTIFGR
jgi:hypothetical protein